MVKSPRKSSADHPDELREKLKVLEGDRNALEESSKAKIEQNRKEIVHLRRENKEMVLQIRELKAPKKNAGGMGVGQKAIEMLDHKVSSQVKKHNMVRAEALKKEQELVKVQKKRIEIGRQLSQLKAHEGGESEETILIRELENKFDKATIREAEAKAIGVTYGKIIRQLEKERMNFDNEVTQLEETLAARREEIARLSSLCKDAIKARDLAKKELASEEKKVSEAKAARDIEKRRLNALAEEQRKKYDAMERRLRNSSNTSSRREESKDNGDVVQTMESYEEAMRRIQDATGVADIQEVVTRYYAQGESKAYLEEMREKNAELLDTLREDYDMVTKQFESLKYSGEARNSSNQRMLSEFERHLNSAENKRNMAEATLKSSSTMLVKVKTGIDHLHDKLETLKPVTHRAANSADTKLEESQLRLTELIKELEQRKADLADQDDPEEVPLVVPEHNTRIAIKTADDEDQKVEDSESEDEFVVSRAQIKQQAQNLVDSKNQKPKKKKRSRY